jgi:hypothetical protein
MKCLLCPAEIDELKEIPGPLLGASDLDKAKAEIAQREHSAKLNAWRFMFLRLDEGNSLAEDKDLVQGHICPAHAGLKPGDVSIALKGGAF